MQVKWQAWTKQRHDSLLWIGMVVTGLGFFSGFPLLLTGSTMQAWATQRGFSLVSIGALSLLGLPYLLKWLWAPALDRLRFGPQYTGRRGWMLLSQGVMVLSLLAMAFSGAALKLWEMAAFLVAFSSATQDLAIDAYRIEYLDPGNYGLGAALNSIGYRIAMMLAGGVMLLVADHVGWSMAYELAAGVMLLGMAWTLGCPRVEYDDQVVRCASVWRSAWDDLLDHAQVWWWLGLVVIYRFADAVVANLGSVFLLRHCHLSLSEVGLLYKVVGVLATVFGATVCGVWLKRAPVKQVLWLCAIAQMLSCIPYIIVAFLGAQAPFWSVAVTVALECLCSGMAITALAVLLMNWCEKSHIATQFAWLTALVAIPRVLLGPVIGQMADYLGWVGVFVATTLVALWPLLLLYGPLADAKMPNRQLGVTSI